MTDSELATKIKDIVAEKLNVKLDDISNDSNFVDDLGADSLDKVELVMALEDEFDIEISDDEADTLTNVDKVFEYIKNKVS